MPTDVQERPVAEPARPPRRDDPEALIEEARRRARRRRRGYVTALGLAVLAGVGVYLVVWGAGSGARSGSSSPSPAVSVPESFGPGQFWYMRTVSTWRVSRPAGGEFQARVFMRARGPMVAFDVRVSEETWVGVDGTVRQRRLVVSRRFASPAGRARWTAYHRRLPNFAGDIDSDSITLGNGLFAASGSSGDPLGPEDIGDGAFTYRQLLALPTQPAQLRAHLEHAFSALAHRQADSALNRCGSGAVAGCRSGPRPPAWQRRDTLASTEMTQIAELLSWPVPERLRLAVVRAATTLRAVSSDVGVNMRARDSLGRPGVAVTASPPHYPGHYEPDPMRLIFDRATGALLAQPGFGAQGVVTAQGVTDSSRELPGGVGPVRSSGALPPPPVVSISPAIGGRATVFTVSVTAHPGARVSGHAPSLGGGVSGPVYRGCASGFTTPAPPSPPPWLSLPPTTTSRAGTPVYVYRLRPPVGTGNTWCPGRYQLQLDTSRLGPPGPAGTGTAIDFQVR